MVYVAENSHFWSSLEMLRNCIATYSKCDKTYLLNGINNTIAQGYRLKMVCRPRKSAKSKSRNYGGSLHKQAVEVIRAELAESRPTVRRKPPVQHRQPAISALADKS